MDKKVAAMIRYVFLTCSFFASGLFSCQLITFSKVFDSHAGKESGFRLVSDTTKSQRLAVLEVDGFSQDDEAVFSTIYEKAKSIGANSFSLAVRTNPDASKQEFRAYHYFLNLYYTPSEQIPLDLDQVYFFSHSSKEQKVYFNDKKVKLAARHFFVFDVRKEGLVIRTGGLLGSKVYLPKSSGQEALYFQSVSSRFSANAYGESGVHFKTGDIHKLSSSYADFLRVIYQKE